MVFVFAGGARDKEPYYEFGIDIVIIGRCHVEGGRHVTGRKARFGRVAWKGVRL